MAGDDVLNRAIKYVLLPVCASLVALVGIEAALRLSGAQADFFFQPDPLISATYIPGKRGWSGPTDVRQWIEINSFGYRDREWVVGKPPHTVRVALLGDSYVAGLEVATADRVSEQLAERVNRRCDDGKQYEVMNFGVTGYGTAQELETLRHRALQFRPDLVLLFFYTGNDLFDNDVELDPQPNRLHYVLGAEGQLEALPFTVSDNGLKRWLRSHSHAYNFVRDRIGTVAAVHRALMAVGAMQDTGARQDVGSALIALQGSQFRVDAPPTIERSWAITAALLDETRRLATAHGARFGVVVIPTRETVERMLPAASAARAADWDLELPLRRMRTICAALDLSCLDLVDAFRAADIAPAFLAEGHWGPVGHALAAAAVSDWLGDDICRMGFEAGAAQWALRAQRNDAH
jgi:hypothetical protein